MYKKEIIIKVLDRIKNKKYNKIVSNHNEVMYNWSKLPQAKQAMENRLIRQEQGVL